MTIEEQLRQAIARRTQGVEPSSDALDRIRDRLEKEPPMDFRSPSTRLLLAAAAVLVVVAAIVGGVVLRGDDDPDRLDIVDENPTTTDPTTPGSTVTSTPTTAETTPTTPATAIPPLDVERQSAIWPRPSSSNTFDTPAAVARSFALYYAFFESPVVGTFRPTGSQSGEVPVRAASGTPESRVQVRQHADGKWYVTGSLATDITLTDPVADAPGGLACPEVSVSGTALAFEGTVNVRIDAYQPDGDRVELGSDIVTGSGSPPAGPFSGRIPCSYPQGEVEDYAVLTLWTVSEASPPELTGTLQIVSIPLRLPG